MGHALRRWMLMWPLRRRPRRVPYRDHAVPVGRKP